MAIQQNFPSSRPSLSLNFARSKKLDPRITFTRTSSATYTDENGLIKIAPANEARFDHDPVTGESLGLLIEESRSNLLRWSEDFTQAGTGSGLWDSGQATTTRISNASISPDGTLTADKLVEGTSSLAGYSWYQPNTITGTDNLCFSVFAKSAGRRYITVDIWDGNTIAASAKFDLQTGTYISSGFTGGGAISVVNYGITSYPDGWYRCYFTANRSSITYIYSRILIGKDDPYAIYTGDGTSGIFIWGAQLERGAFPTSYIPTTASTVTRTADNASMTGSNFSSWFRQGEGTILTESRSSSGATYTGFIYRFQSNVGLNLIDHYRQVDNQPVSSITFDGVNIYGAIGNGPIWTGTSKNRFALAYSSQSANQASNGNLAWVDDTNVTIPTLNLVRLGSNGGVALNGTISQLTYYPSRLPNQTLQNLTK